MNKRYQEIAKELEELRFSWRIQSSYKDNNLVLEAAHAIEKLQARNADLERERDELAAHVELSLKLANAIENENDLPHHKWALKCSHLVAKVKKSPQQSLVEHDAEVARKGWLQGHFHRSTYGVQDAEVVMNEAFNYVNRNYGVKDGE